MSKRPPVPTRAIGYVRVSTDKQADKGGSLAVQRDRVSDYCVLHHLELIGVEADAGISGAKDEDDRPGLAAALAAIRAGQADALIVADVDRLARDADVAGHVRVEVRRAGGTVIVLSEVNESVEVVAVRALLATLERERTRARMRVWASSRRAKGLHMGPAPYGSRIAQDGALVPDEGEARVVARIAALRLQGASLRAIVRTLEEEGLPARPGRRWNQETVRAILARHV